MNTLCTSIAMVLAVCMAYFGEITSLTFVVNRRIEQSTVHTVWMIANSSH